MSKEPHPNGSTYHRESLRGSCVWVSLEPPVGAMRQPGATNIKALRALYGMVFCSVEPLRGSFGYNTHQSPDSRYAPIGGYFPKALRAF